MALTNPFKSPSGKTVRERGRPSPLSAICPRKMPDGPTTKTTDSAPDARTLGFPMDDRDTEAIKSGDHVMFQGGAPVIKREKEVVVKEEVNAVGHVEEKKGFHLEKDVKIEIKKEIIIKEEKFEGEKEKRVKIEQRPMEEMREWTVKWTVKEEVLHNEEKEVVFHEEREIVIEEAIEVVIGEEKAMVEDEKEIVLETENKLETKGEMKVVIGRENDIVIGGETGDLGVESNEIVLGERNIEVCGEQGVEGESECEVEIEGEKEVVIGYEGGSASEGDSSCIVISSDSFEEDSSTIQHCKGNSREADTNVASPESSQDPEEEEEEENLDEEDENDEFDYDYDYEEYGNRGYDYYYDEEEEEEEVEFCQGFDPDSHTVIYTRHKRGFPLAQEYRQSDLDFPTQYRRPEPIPKEYPWRLISYLKDRLSISPKERAVRYLLPLFKGWTLTHKDPTPRACPCGETTDCLTHYRKENTFRRSSVEIAVGRQCGCTQFFQPGLAEKVDAALTYLKSHAVFVRYVKPTSSERHKFQILATDERHPLFQDDIVIDYLKSIFKYFFVNRYGTTCYVEAKLQNKLTAYGLHNGDCYDAQLMPDMYCMWYGAGISMTIKFFGKVQ